MPKFQEQRNTQPIGKYSREQLEALGYGCLLGEIGQPLAIDPEKEYAALVQQLGGLPVSANSHRAP